MRVACKVAAMSALVASATSFMPTPALTTAPREHVMSGAVTQLQMSVPPLASRRALLGSAAVIAGNFCLGEASAATAATRLPSKDDVLIYVGAGCFWHVQHEMTVAEQALLGRDGNSFTAVAGYAGGNKLGKDGKVCYHNMAFDSDYGSFGHTEVVAVQVPADAVEGFVTAYVDLFDKSGVRHDPQDQGGEYRSALGLPGGVKNEKSMRVLTEAAAKKGMTVVAGKGDEGDTLRDRTIFVYDTTQFPFHAGELYHQYHNDMTENYGKKYNALRDSKATEGALAISKCPGDAKLTGVFASGDFASSGIFDGFFQDKSVND